MTTKKVNGLDPARSSMAQFEMMLVPRLEQHVDEGIQIMEDCLYNGNRFCWQNTKEIIRNSVRRAKDSITLIHLQVSGDKIGGPSVS